MPLLLRRGTNSERLTITPANGELIYVTDTKQLFVGDGTTLGGNGVTSSFGGTVLNDDLNVNGYEINGTGTINLIGTITAQNGFIGDVRGGLVADDLIYMIDSATKIGYFNELHAQNGFMGDLTGSVFSNSSTLIVDGNDGTITTSTIKTSTNELEIYTETSGITNNLIVTSLAEKSTLTFKRSSNDDRSTQPDIHGTIAFERNDINGSLITSVISGGNNGIYISNDDTGTFAESKTLSVINGNVGIGTYTPAATFDVIGSAIINGNLNVVGNILVQNINGNTIGDHTGNVYATDSSLIINADTTTITASTIFANSVGNHTGTVYSNNSSILIDAENNDAYFDKTNTPILNSPFETLTLSSDISTQSFFVNVKSFDNRSVLSLQKHSEIDDLAIDPGIIGSIFFERADTINNNQVVGVIAGSNTGIYMFSDDTGTYPESNTLNLVGDKVGIGTYYPAETLDVRGSAVFSGEIKAMSVNGMIIADDSSVIVNPATNTVTADTITANELLTLAARSSAPASPTLGMIALADRTTWDPLSVGSGNPYLVLYDGSAWVALA